MLVWDGVSDPVGGRGLLLFPARGKYFRVTLARHLNYSGIAHRSSCP